ncbi:unnamed protein product [Phytophthora fragariaefolia]|uniref:Unnamed protein product n=1 Tax=Phytophthora fragariaefolia TaxID=1490495 RepID=A0A9W6Y549_9STRA|nr:unnamed protein product [Phytophthora fragariaefolia]
MAPTRIPVIIVATLAATFTAVKCSGKNGITQTASTLAPGGIGSFDSANQWSHSTYVPTMTPSVPSGVSGSQWWSQPSSTASSQNNQNVNQESPQQTQTSSSTGTATSSNMAQSIESSSNTASSATKTDSNATQTSVNSTSSADHATFGTVTSKPGECVIGNPNTCVSTADIDWIWTNRIGPSAPTRDANWNVMDNKNWIMDHIVKNKGSLNYCVCWDSTEKLSKTTASKFQVMLERQYAAWNHWLVGYDCWPYNEIDVNVVGFAVKDSSLFDWSDDSLGKITMADLLDPDVVPPCDEQCYRYYDSGTGAWSDTSECKGEPFDFVLWLKQGLGGFSYNWGQQVNLDNTVSALDQDQLVIVAHEIGHGFGLPDFYEDEDQPNANWPKCIMMAGSSMTVTDSDGWMLRRVLEHVKSRYNF